MDQSEFILAMTSILVGGGICLSIVVTIGRLIGRRRGGGELDAAGLGQLDARLSRMEQAIDAMAVEVERVSEAQRFTSKLLADRAGERPGAHLDPRS